MLLLPITNKVL